MWKHKRAMEKRSDIDPTQSSMRRLWSERAWADRVGDISGGVEDMDMCK